MPNTTSSALDLFIASLEPIAPDWLATVSGGCHKKCCPPQQPAPQMAAPAPQMAPVDPGPSVQTNVSIAYQ